MVLNNKIFSVTICNIRNTKPNIRWLTEITATRKREACILQYMRKCGKYLWNLISKCIAVTCRRPKVNQWGCDIRCGGYTSFICLMPIFPLCAYRVDTIVSTGVVRAHITTFNCTVYFQHSESGASEKKIVHDADTSIVRATHSQTPRAQQQQPTPTGAYWVFAPMTTTTPSQEKLRVKDHL